MEKNQNLVAKARNQVDIIGYILQTTSDILSCPLISSAK